MRVFPGLLLAFALVALPAAGMADSTSKAGIDRLEAHLRKDKSLPDDPSFYAETLHVGHNWDTGRMVKAADLVKTVSFDRYFKENGITNIELTRLVASGDTVIAAVLLTGQKPDGTPTRFTMATFYRLENGKIVDIQEWYDRAERDQRAYAH
jgi:ketosteroid isomerase-like protein